MYVRFKTSSFGNSYGTIEYESICFLNGILVTILDEFHSHLLLFQIFKSQYDPHSIGVLLSVTICFHHDKNFDLPKVIQYKSYKKFAYALAHKICFVFDPKKYTLNQKLIPT